MPPDPCQQSIGQLCDDANAAMTEVALFVQTVNESGEPWTPDRMARLRKLQAEYSTRARLIAQHPDAHTVETRTGPVIGARKRS